MRGDGNGWAQGPGDTQVWGRYGAAGLFLVAPLIDAVLLQHRAPWTASGGTWALPGGARDSHETAVDAALRETLEETGIEAQDVTVREALVTAGPFDSGWTYTTVTAVTATGEALTTTPNRESLELQWVRFGDVEKLPLLPAFGQAFPGLVAGMGL